MTEPMRDALKQIVAIYDVCAGPTDRDDMAQMADIAKAALAAPEQHCETCKRWQRYSDGKAQSAFGNCSLLTYQSGPSAQTGTERVCNESWLDTRSDFGCTEWEAKP